MFDKILNLNNNGYIFTKEIVKNNIPTIYLTRLVRQGLIKKVAAGVYILNDYIEDELYINYLKNKDLIYTNNTALYLQNLTPKQLINYEVNFPYGKNTSKLDHFEYKVLRNKTLYNLGKEFILTPMGNSVPCYDKERCICNLFLNNFCDDEVKSFAIREYKNYYLDIIKLYEYAKTLNIYKEVKNVFEVLLWD